MQNVYGECSGGYQRMFVAEVKQGTNITMEPCSVESCYFSTIIYNWVLNLIIGKNVCVC